MNGVLINMDNVTHIRVQDKKTIVFTYVNDRQSQFTYDSEEKATAMLLELKRQLQE